MQESKACPEHCVNFCLGRKEQNEVNCFISFSRFLSFIVFAISKSPQGYASAAFSVQHRRKKSGCHFCELGALERRSGGMTQPAGLGRRGWGPSGAGCRDRLHLGRCASVSLHIHGRMNHPTDVGRQGQAVTPAMRARVLQPRKDAEYNGIGVRGSSGDQKTLLTSDLWTKAEHRPKKKPCC